MRAAPPTSGVVSASLALVILVAIGHAAGDADLDPERLAGPEWRLYSDVFPMLPDEGYRILLGADGAAEAANLAEVTRWTLRLPDRLELLSADGRAVWTFRWYASKNLFVSCPDPPGFPTPPIVLAPPGATIASIGDGLRDLGRYRCGSPP